MGYLTTITFYNDRIDEFFAKPQELVKLLRDGKNQAQRTQREVSLCGGYISIQPSRHADDETIYVHTGNCVFNLNPYNDDFKELLNRDPEIAEKFVKRAERILKTAKAMIKQRKVEKSS